MEYALFPINHAAGDVLGAFGVDSLAGGGDGEGAAGDGYILGGLDGVVARGDADIAARDVHIALVGLILVVGLDGVLAGGQGDGAVLDGHGIVALQGVFHGGYGDDAARDAQVVLGADAVVEVALHVQRARAVDHQVVAGADAGVGLLFKGGGVGLAVGKGVDGVGGQGEGHLVSREHVQGRGALAGQGQAGQYQLGLLGLVDLHQHLAVGTGALQLVYAGGGDGDHRAVGCRAAAVDRHRRIGKGDLRGGSPAVAQVKAGKYVAVIGGQGGAQAARQQQGKRQGKQFLHYYISFADGMVLHRCIISFGRLKCKRRLDGFTNPSQEGGRSSKLACMSIRTGGSCHAGNERFVHHSAVAAVCGSGEGTFHDRNWRILNRNEQFDGHMAIRCAILQSG